MAVVTMKQLLESGVHFGHATRRWDPKMAPYIFTSRNGIHIIDLKLTQQKIEESYKALFDIVSEGGKVLFVGTKKQAQNAVEKEALRVGHYFVNQRWLGGTLTNFKTIRLRIKKLHDLHKMEKDGVFEKLPKKEVLKLIGERERLEKFLGGIKEMKKVPEAIFVVDPKKEINAVLEARKLNIPVFGIVDTNCDPDLVDYIIPGNDDAIRAVNLITNVMANAVTEAQGGYVEKYDEEESKRTDRQPRQQRAPRTDDKPRRTETKPRDVKEAVKPAPKAQAKPAPKAEEKVAPKVKAASKAEKVDYSKLTIAALKDLARDNNISGFSTLRKADLVKLIEENLK